MCGIYCSISFGSPIHSSRETQELLKARGPDSTQAVSISLQIPNPTREAVHIHIFSTVLALRGDHIESQPLKDKHTESFLCWNGEAWRENGQVIGGNDSQHVFTLLLRACQSSANPSTETVIDALTSIAGPFAFIFYDAVSCRLFYGRDHLGRRSLLSRATCNGGMAFCSITDVPLSPGWKEVEAGGVYCVAPSNLPLSPDLLPWTMNLPRIDRSLPNGSVPLLSLSSETILKLEKYLRQSLHLRITDVPNLGQAKNNQDSEDAKIAVLFSGGLDCTLLARLAHDLLPPSQPIDLLNVAFENPRSMVAASGKDPTASAYESCPDRKTGRSSYLELLRICGGRKWRFIAINVPYKESESHHSTIAGLMAPHNTEMDLSIAKALYFAARGQGQIRNTISGQDHPYSTDARVLLSGLGADELFGGYRRHATAYARDGYPGLIEELDLDIQRLGQRNLGRDDRVISHWAKEARYPYLDEEFMKWTLQLPVWEKCGFRPDSASTVVSKEDNRSPPILDPAKQALRLLAWRLGMEQVARERKRAIQFGARTAKMQIGKGRKRGTDLIDG
ncbi:hypothetical protein GJ744_001648 [Endocarpon pusillum]|uniref:Glutamine amidotransferase type-2 domain-containing protein n=1 Tax=Endocarpon pusillum TaxID=364733 RepID=A0A8H7E107_9EURO|nr:hypothetical protein GJ744_001648 [Endocarpon pusillum]